MTQFPNLSLAFELREKAAHLCKRPPIGCTSLQIEAMESEVGHALPQAYREFLERMGSDDGGCFLHQKWTVENLRLNRMLLEEVLEENDLTSWMPEEHFVFMSDEGMLYAWFPLPVVSDDPPVHALVLAEETSAQDLQIFPSFSSFLLESMTHAVEALIEAASEVSPRAAGTFPVIARLESPEHAAVVKNALFQEGIGAYITHSHLNGEAFLHVNEKDVERANSLLELWAKEAP
ncbi:MAG: SMI1/KNR4 family protein [Planctomycetota bacterium]